MNKEELTSGLVSIVMPCYNGEQFIDETIKSVLNQTYQKWELLVIDDGSRDSSASIVQNYAKDDQRIRLIQQQNAGSAAARNNGIRQSKGQYLALLDSDDIWLPGFLDSQVRFIRQKGSICVCSSYLRIDEQSNEIMRPVMAKAIITSKDMQSVDYVGCLTGLYDQSKYGKIYLKEELKSLLDDYAFWIDAISLEGKAYGNPKILAEYRVRKNSLTGNKKKLIKKHYHFYRNYLKQNALRSSFSVLKWGIDGLIKYL
ncbi:glycosyltransferase family 2 protein [Limosilactobacillus pontis]|uniref:glycosyltransferase family 2 protein n=1 Tax=Limosilactobacillus pontis TaxID=35787 RepID=UPI00241FD9A8|nr:glycosyltransferase family 2 protein [Limosilactobacillus pontis]